MRICIEKPDPVTVTTQMIEVVYEGQPSEDGNISYREVQRIHLNPAEGKYGCQIPKGAWHTVEVIEPSVIFEAKDGAYQQ